MENYIILPSLYFFLSFTLFFNNLRHKMSKFDNSNAREITITFFTFALWIVGITYCGYYAYLTEWYMFPVIVIAALIFDMIFNALLTLLIVIGANANIGVFMSLNNMLKDTVLCVIVTVFCAFQMFVSIV